MANITLNNQISVGLSGDTLILPEVETKGNLNVTIDVVGSGTLTPAATDKINGQSGNYSLAEGKYILFTSGAQNSGWSVTASVASAGGGGTPGGTTGQIQYNNSGAFGGISNGTAGQVLTSNGAGSAPSFQAATGGGSGYGPNTVNLTGDYTATTDDGLITWDGSADYTVTLPTDPPLGTRISFKITGDPTTQRLRILRGGTDYIGGGYSDVFLGYIHWVFAAGPIAFEYQSGSWNCISGLFAGIADMLFPNGSGLFFNSDSTIGNGFYCLGCQGPVSGSVQVGIVDPGIASVSLGFVDSGGIPDGHTVIWSAGPGTGGFLRDGGAPAGSDANTTVAGSTSGNLYWSMPFRGSSYKKVVISLDAFDDDGSGGTIAFPVSFTYPPGYKVLDGGDTITPSSISGSQIVLPATSGAKTLVIIVEGI